MKVEKFSFSQWILVLMLSMTQIDELFGAPQPNRHRHATHERGSGDYTVTHLDIRDAVLSLVRILQDQIDKLERHEVRERQLGEQLTRSISILDKRTRGEEKNIENIAGFLGRVEEKVKLVQQTLEKQSDERRVEHEVTGLEFKGLKQMLGDKNQDTQKFERKLDHLSEKMNVLREASERNSAKFDSLMELWRASTNSGAESDLSDSLMQELTEIKDAISKTAEIIVSSSKSNGNEQLTQWQGEFMESLDTQKRQLALLEEEIDKALSLLGEMTKSASGLQFVITELNNDTAKGFETLSSHVQSLKSHVTKTIDSAVDTSKMKISKSVEEEDDSKKLGLELAEKLDHIQEMLKIGQKALEQKVKGAETALEILYTKMENGYGHLADELKGLSNVESVLLDTGDSVMETKRRLEYGVQQIMGELNIQLKEHTSNLNTSLQHRFDVLATAVLGNQSRAITNLTSRMEEDISQVWRQIGTLYQEMSRSANLLDTIHSQTSKYVNNSLDTMSSMDGKVGQITNRMGEVDDNLNYLLGRMSLVVQEFNMIKSGLGEALLSLKDSFNELQDIEKLEKKQDGGDHTPSSNPQLEKIEGGGVSASPN